MAFTEALRLLIDADTGGAVRNINAVGAATDKSLGRSQRTIDKWSRGLTTAGAGMVAFGAASLFGLGKAAMASEDANLAVVKLENTLANMPRLAGENSKSFIDLAQSIQDKTAADADQIIEAEALLGTFQVTGDEIRNLTPLVVDLARKFGIDMNSAAIQVGKALDGNIGALKRNGISIDENLFKTDRYAAVTQALRDQVGGFAEAEGKTFAGSLERLKNQMGDVAEGVGVGAVDAFSSLFGVVEGGIDKIKQLSPETQSAIGKFATFGSVALVAAGGVSFLIGQVLKAAENFSIARAAVADFAGAGGLGRLARVSLVVGGFIALREVLQTLDDDLEGIDVAKLESQLLDLAETGELTGDRLGRIFEDFGKAIESGDPQKIEAVANQLGKVDEALAQLASRDPEAAAASFRVIADRLEELGASRSQINDLFNDYIAAATNADTASRTAKGGVDDLAGGMEDQAGSTEEATSALQEYSDHLKALTDPIFAAMDAMTGIRDAQLAEKDAAVAVIEAQNALNEARAAGDPAAVAEAERGLADAQRELSDAQWATVESAAEADAALAGLQDAVQRGDVSVDAFKDTLATWVRQGFFTQQQADAAAREVQGLAGAARNADRERVDIPVKTPGSGTSRSELTRVRDAAHSVPTRRNTRVSTSGTSTARGNILDVVGAVFSLPTSRTIYINVAGAAAAANALARAGRQHGGPVLAGEAYVVGEAGPELLVMGGQSGTIVPNGGFGRPSGGGAMAAAGTVNVQLHITGSGRLAEEFHRAVRVGDIQLTANGQRVKVG